MPSLYAYDDCPYCFRLRVYLAERGVQVELIRCERGALPPELLSYAPLGKLPVWMTGAGKSLWGSRTITAFVDAVAPGEALLPADPVLRARIDMALDLVDEGLLAALLRLDKLTAGREPSEWDLTAYEREAQQVRHWLEVFAQLLGERSWLVGDRLTPADLALLQPLSVLERYGLSLERWPALQGLLERLDRRPAVVQTRASVSAHARRVTSD